MTERVPIETKNLDIYGHVVLPWNRPWIRLAITFCREIGWPV
ncbi:MAG: hypothetical protein Q8R87_11100 [Anaerolineaceae bacterium]|nr:hypothetical protein [Anaerolineaceae bacterium]